MSGNALPSAPAPTPTPSLTTASAPAPKIAVPDAPTSAVVETVLTEALPVPDMVFGGSMLVVVIMFHAFWIRLITSSFLKRSRGEGAHTGLWRADLLFAATVVALLSLHMAEIFVWTVGLVGGNIVDGWAKASYFAANCYTALGEPFSLPHAWRLLPPIIAMSGIFTFAWTASVLVNFVARYNELRAETLAQRDQRREKGQAAQRPAQTPKGP